MNSIISEQLDNNLEWTLQHLTAEQSSLLTKHTHDTSVWNSSENQDILTNILNQIPGTSVDINLYSGAEHALSTYNFYVPLNLEYFTSSYDWNVAVKYTNMLKSGGLFVLHIPKGSKILCLDNLSIHGSAEHEVLLSGNARLYITKIDTVSNTYPVIYATYNDSNLVE